MLASGETSPLVVLANRQLKGRGRLGRVWHSPAEGNLYSSFAFRPQADPARMQRFTLWMGLKLCQMLQEKYGVPVLVKWPNDLVIKEGENFRKLAGMLTEARIDADRIRDLVFGLGLNLSTPAAGWPEELAGRAVSLAEIVGKLDVNTVAAEVILCGVQAYDTFLERSIAEDLQRQWPAVDALRGQNVTATRSGEPFRGKALGINDDGSLLLQADGGKTQAFSAGEVTLSKELR